jgi:hypothetical protein
MTPFKINLLDIDHDTVILEKCNYFIYNYVIESLWWTIKHKMKWLVFLRSNLYDPN